MSSKVPPGMVRLFLFICFAMVVVAPAASAQNAAALTGVYNGTYRCAQGATNLKLSLTTTASGELSGLFTFYLPPGTQNQGRRSMSPPGTPASSPARPTATMRSFWIRMRPS